jgi:uroporphyrin-3 C-methyltransferase
MTEQKDDKADKGTNKPARPPRGKRRPKSDKPDSAAAPPRRPARWPMVLAVVLALGAAGGSGYTWYMQQIRHEALQSRLTELQTTLRALDEHSSLIEIKQRLGEQNKQLSSALSEQQEKIDALYKAFEVTREAVNRDQRGWIMAEVEYLMRLANVRLRLTHDIKGATQALITADERLADLGDPAVLEIRERLAGEISALKSMNTPDVEGVALKLMSIGNRLHLLPTAKRPAVDGDDAESRPSAGEPDGVFKRAGWRVLNFIGVRQTDAPVTTAKLQSELYYVEQLLRLELARAREAALRMERDTYQRHINSARTLLDRHYERDHEQVIRIRAELAELRETELIPPLPDISGSLRRLRELQLKYQPDPAVEPATDS